MRKKITATLIVSLMSTMPLLINGCSGTSKQHNTAMPPPQNRLETRSSQHLTMQSQTPTYSGLVPLSKAFRSLGLRYEEHQGTAKAGYTDAAYECKAGSLQAKAGGREIRLPEAPVQSGNELMMSEASLEQLLERPVHWNMATGTLESGEVRGGPVEPAPSQAEPKQPHSGRESAEAVPSRPYHATNNTDRSALVDYAKKFMGTPYDFGAGSYEKDGTFDCSSFTQHVFSHFNIDLPRIAREQAGVGSKVSRNQLQPGDLIFFTVPGRFQNDRIPGHVGIYMGNGKFIHTWGEPGVTVNDLDTGYWHGKILSMRDVI
ncbi:NlpC/P60 family protein [Paenibacillus sp. JX-17]|uniref:NlpC/P60 family protein n=1 Tax=Paenibacillus lacisoli TaxID=3064525 RepID=A0ABT9C8T9_9BACL|nr:C40 family peptidase [Paenibacillus sp. JX-17]MDO7905675.1 NlpC/P60 family protein [Paenibacillus sp. JX-17]